MTDVYAYDSAFQNMASASASAARRIITAVKTILPVRSVVDIGCARGAWLREWQKQSVDDVVGVDGDYVDRDQLAIDHSRFLERDLTNRFDLGRQFDLVECLEVAEHLPQNRALTFVADIVSHAPVVLFSAAPPGQGGENHVNEQSCEYWRALFLRHDYVAIDCLRPLLAKERSIPVWYRNNLMLYVRRNYLEQIAPFARQFQLQDEEKVRDFSTPLYKLRKLVIRMLPKAVCDALARYNARRYPEI